MPNTFGTFRFAWNISWIRSDPRGFVQNVKPLGNAWACVENLVGHREIHEVRGNCQTCWNVPVCVAKISWITGRSMRDCTTRQPPGNAWACAGNLVGHREIHEVLRELSNTLERSGMCGQKVVDHREIHEVLHNTSNPLGMLGLVWGISWIT